MPGGVWALALVLPVGAAAADRVAIDHAPLECVLYDRYTRIAVTATGEVASAQLQFRAAGEGGWYSVAMAAEGAEWSAVLPRPTRSLARLEYRIVMRSRDARETATPVIAVMVASSAACEGPGRSSAEVAAPIVVHVPAGSPLVPPVPAGFSPAGVVAFEEQKRTPGMRTVLLGTGLAAGIGALVVGGGDASGPPAIHDLPEFAFSGTRPLPGAVLSLSRDQLSAFVALTGRANPPFNFQWRFELIGAGTNTVCVFMSATTRSSTPPAVVTLTATLRPINDCGPRFDVDRSRLRIQFGGRVVHESEQAPLPFRFEP